jgi:ribonucleoside-triphosphate reductase
VTFQDPGAQALSHLVGLRTYQQFDRELERRETLGEAQERMFAFFEERAPELLTNRYLVEDWAGAKDLVRSLNVLPSLRWLAGARPGGPAPGEVVNDIVGYNCMTQVFDRPGFLWQTLYVAMAGCGVGASVEKRIKRDGKWVKILTNMPKIKPISSNPVWLRRVKDRILNEYPDYDNGTGRFVVQDSTEGWARAVQVATWLAWVGASVADFFDYSQIRLKGAPLLRKGGFASGPQPLIDLIEAVFRVCAQAAGRKLRSDEAHYLYTMVGASVVVGGVRRMAAITTSDIRDQRMMVYKDWKHPGGGLRVQPEACHVSNNSAAVTSRTTEYELRNELRHTFEAENGERGLWFEQGITQSHLRGNACGEITNDWLPADNTDFYNRGFLPDYDDGGAGGMCNLTAAVLRFNDTAKTAVAKVIAAALFGTVQAKLTDFGILPPGWKKLADRDAQLGVDITGQTDAMHLTADVDLMASLRATAEMANDIFADALGINRAARVTTVKPGGNSAALAMCSSGASARHSRYSIQRMEIAADHPIAKALKVSAPEIIVAKPGTASHGWVEDKDGRRIDYASLQEISAKYGALENGIRVPVENRVEGGLYLVENEDLAHTILVEFPLETPPGALSREEDTAAAQLARYRRLRSGWVSGPRRQAISITVSYRPEEVPDLIEDIVSGWRKEDECQWAGLSFLPYSPDVYFRAPREELTEAAFRAKQEAFIEAWWRIDWDLYRELDSGAVDGRATGECSGKGCELRFS